MARRKKHTELEDAVWGAWNAIVFPGNYYEHIQGSREDAIEHERARVPRWDAVLAMAHDGQEWKVGPQIAAAVAGSRWWNAMIQREHARAEEEAKRALSHPLPIDKGHKIGLLSQLHVAQLLGGDQLKAANGLKALLHSGIERPPAVATSILHSLVFVEDIDVTVPASDEMKSLAKEIAIARKWPMRTHRDIDSSVTLVELLETLHDRLAFQHGWRIEEEAPE